MRLSQRSTRCRRPAALPRRRTSDFFAVCGLYLLLLCVRLPAQTAQHFGHQAWSTEDGLPQNSVHQVLQTKDGYLWIATEGGLARFDGLSFSVFRHEEESELPSDDIACLAEDQGGSLWIGTTAGLAQYRDGRFRPIARSSRDPSFSRDASLPAVLALAAAGDGSVLALTTGGGVLRVAGQVASPLPGLAGDASSLASARDGSVWLTAGSRLLQYRSGQLTDQGPLPADRSMEGLQVESDGGLALRSPDGFWRRSISAAALWTRSPEAPISAQASLRDRSGHLWAGTKRGLYRFGSAGEPPQIIQELGTRSILSLLQDREGNVWVGTEADGLHVLRAQTFTQTPDLNDHVITALAQTADGAVWIGTRDDGLRVYRSATPGKVAHGEEPPLAKALDSRVILALAAGVHGDLWIGTLAGLDHIDRGHLERFSSADGLPDDAVRSLFVEADGSLWVGTRRGLVHWQGAARRGHSTLPGAGHSGPSRMDGSAEPSMTHVKGLPSDLIGAMLRLRHVSERSSGPPDATTPLWVATLDGLSRLDGGANDGAVTNLVVSSDLAGAVITSMAEDTSGTLWVGTRGKGLAAVAGGMLRSMHAGLPQAINSLVADRRGALWLGTPHGIFRVATADLHGCLDRGECTPPVARFGYADGMATEEATAGGHPATLVAEDGRLWFAMAKGVAIVDPAHLRENSVPPQVVIERLLVDNRSVRERPESTSAPRSDTPATPLSLPFSRGSMTFDYAGLSFIAPARVRYRYQLEGFDRQWTEAGTRRSAYYTNLPPGSYTFRVQAANSDGLWNRGGAELAFTIRPPFYRRLWFYGLLVLALLSAGYAVYTLRVRRLRSKFDAVLGERTRIAREIHDTLAQNFVGISIHLQIVEQLLEAKDIAATETQLQQTRALVQEGLNDARQSIWELRASVAQDSLPTRLSRAVERAARPGLTEQVTIGGIYRPLAPDTEKEVLRIAQEALANVTRHAQASELRVELRYDTDQLRLAVMDNGRGFDPDAVTPAGDHFGLAGMRERAATLAGTLSVVGDTGKGTSVTLTVPLGKAERRTP